MTSKFVTLFASILLYLIVTIQLRADNESNENTSVSQREHANVFQKLRDIIIESIHLNNVTPKEALKFLSDASIKADPDHKGVSFVGHFTREDSSTRVSVNLNHVSLKQALKHMFFYGVEGSVVYVEYEHGEAGFCSRTFLLPNGLYLLGPIPPGEKPKQSYNVLKLLSNGGVRFAPRATATFRPDENKLTVVATSEEINDVDELLNR